MFWEVHRNQEWEESPWSQWIVILLLTLPIAVHCEGITLQILTAKLMLSSPCLNPFTWNPLQLFAMTWVWSACGKSKAFPASQFYFYCHKSLIVSVTACWLMNHWLNTRNWSVAVAEVIWQATFSATLFRFKTILICTIGKMRVQKLTGILALWTLPRVTKSLWGCSSEKGNCNGGAWLTYEIWEDTVKNRWLYHAGYEGRERDKVMRRDGES